MLPDFFCLSSHCFIHQSSQLPLGLLQNWLCIIITNAFFSTFIVTPYDISVTGNNTYPHGSKLQLHCSSEGGPRLEYSWSNPNSSYTATNNLTISNVSTLDGGNYTCTVTNDAGSSSNTVTVYGELAHITHVSIFLCVCVKLRVSEWVKILLNIVNSWTSVHYSSNESGGGY